MKRATIACWLVSGGVAGATLLGQLDRAGLQGWPGWVFDLFAHWPRHLLFMGLLAGGVALWLRLRIAATTSFAVAAVNLFVLVVTDHASPQAPPEGARFVRIVSANVHRSMAAVETVTKLARDYGADIVALYESPKALTPDRLKELLPDLKMISVTQALSDRPLNGDSALALRRSPGIVTSYYDGSRGVLLSAFADNVHVVATHPPSPTRPGMLADRDRQLADTDIDFEPRGPFIVAGDFNTTPWGRAYASVPGTRAGDPRFEGTFPAFAGPFGLPIDHIKFGGGLVLTDYRVGPDIGSDHLPLFATFALPDN